MVSLDNAPASSMHKAVKFGIDRLPIEIWLAICKEATALPSVFFSDPFFVHLSEKDSIEAAIPKSYAVKCALRATCRLFHDIANRLLFDVLILEDAKHIPSFVGLLRKSSNDGRSLGWWCRTLYLHLWQVNPDWEVGRQSLWGLLEACPNVVDLRCSAAGYDFRNSRLEYMGTPYFTPVQLLQQIAAIYGPNLKRFELMGWLKVHVRDLERFLAYCPVLEICRLAGVYDSEAGTSTITDYQLVWPGPAPDCVYLPRLRTLDLLYDDLFLRFTGGTRTGFQGKVREWILPSLHTMHTEVNEKEHTPESTKQLLIDGLTPHVTRLKNFSYHGPSWSFWHLIKLLPYLENVHVSTAMDFDRTDEAVVHKALHTIMIDDRGDDRMDYSPPGLQYVLQVVQARKLPSLAAVGVAHFAGVHDDEPFASLRGRYRAEGVFLDLPIKLVPVRAGPLDNAWVYRS